MSSMADPTRIEDPLSDEDLVTEIADMEHVCAVMIWPAGSGKFLGCLLDSHVDEIGGSRTWSAVTYREVLESLHRAAIAFRENGGAKRSKRR